ncbi:DUF4397 domain-containing protein [Flavihumibacter profundi]|uniref:DUF4397 domain-containing protein n=1 Tax=Flavihumibacter profundi TaxID=2716883 RepID=UPI001CC75A0F|nr:DUF4397 domain-containing protein [Flavihumibacter profundi]MBZ5855753.1 DUF4397 domain-containing protein [Flavihumibacter profundi]
MKRNLVLAILCLTQFSCLKQKDETGNGPKAHISIINAALDSDPVTLLLDGTKVNETPVPFGEASGNADDAYLATKPGILNTFWQVGETPPNNEKFLQWAPGTYYTMIQYDTAVNNVAPVMLLTDNLAVTDTVARTRFINCVAGNEPLSLWLIGIKDTAKVATKTKALGNGGFAPAGFDARVRPGDWRMELIDTSGNVLYHEDITLAGSSFYSFVSFGEISGTGSKAPVARKLVNLK